MKKKVKHYLEDMTETEKRVLDHQGMFHIARVHNSGKTWVSRDQAFPDRELAERLAQENNDLARSRGWGATDYFVWPKPAESPANKIENADPH